MKYWVITLLAMAVASLGQSEAKSNLLQPILLELRPIQTKIQAFKGNDQQHLVYELMTTNFSKNPIEIMAVNVEGESQEGPYKFTISGEKLKEIFAIPTTERMEPQDPIVPSNGSGILFLFLDFPTLEHIPNLIVNSLDIQTKGQPETLQKIKSNPISIDKSPPISVKPPIEGSGWFSESAASNDNYHRRAMLVLNGNIVFSQRFAVDWAKYGPKGLFDGDPYDNKSYYGYGEKVFAVGPGTVIRALDGIQDNVPGAFPKNPTLDSILGNFILLELDSSHYAFFAHLIPGSLKVKEGDRVEAGQPLGLLGNSGNSSGPHLHFHITDKPLPLERNTKPLPINAQGIPWVLNNFIKEIAIPIGKTSIDETMPQKFEKSSEIQIKEEAIMNNDLVDFNQKTTQEVNK